MGAYGELFPGRKLKHEGDQGSPGREHDPGGPLDLDRGVVFLSAPAKAERESPGEDADQDER
ncbi:hypothetical protein FHX42_002582 [Saccharopolyspora lacisalsi]|uniref:Uncharacterized protein n=1 Tax=Halosaccharopolyspora lacisalsi TaxID=1000566 RepID=A0A839E1D7_9PSEU|nr:hypothetical protein [Halosaccharopolyspora lacisalsi]MBA8825231.1 hypothetical protein [Halosaccharopolyspora lacisalsi]